MNTAPTGRVGNNKYERVWRYAGYVFLGLGAFVGLFVVYLLTLTNVEEHASQNSLHRAISDAEATSRSTFSSHYGPRTTQPLATTPAPPVGAWIGTLTIRRIHLSVVFVQGTSGSQLAEGPGHYVATPLPGERGNVAIAGHRTTFGAPFRDLNNLRIDDAIVITTPTARVLYRVGSIRTVLPTDLAVLYPTFDNRLTLTTCTPPYSASYRLVILAHLVWVQRRLESPAQTRAVVHSQRQQAHQSQRQGWWGVALYGEAFALAVGLGLRWLHHSRHRVVAVTVMVLVVGSLLLPLFDALSTLGGSLF